MTRILVNGEALETETNRLETLFSELGLHAPLLLVEYNGTALARSEWETITLREGDRLELLSVAAGG
jgi:thiamine biosynthesis protein ThiS